MAMHANVRRMTLKDGLAISEIAPSIGRALAAMVALVGQFATPRSPPVLPDDAQRS